MDFIKLGEVLLKVTASIAAGAIVFVGVSKAVESSKARSNQQVQGNNGKCNNGGGQQQQPQQPQPYYPQQQLPQQDPESPIMSGIRATQSTCEKLSNMAGAVVTVFEAASKLFGNNSNQQPVSQQYYPNSPWYGNYQGGYTGTPSPVNLTRLDPFITVAGPSTNYQGRNYPV